MIPLMYERVRKSFGSAGLTEGFEVQQLLYEDPKDLTKAIMLFQPNGGTPIRNELGSEYYVLVNVIGAKDKRSQALAAVQRIIDYVQRNPMKDQCLGHIENVGGIPSPALTEEGRIVFRLQFACLYGE